MIFPELVIQTGVEYMWKVYKERMAAETNYLWKVFKFAKQERYRTMFRDSDGFVPQVFSAFPNTTSPPLPFVVLSAQGASETDQRVGREGLGSQVPKYPMQNPEDLRYKDPFHDVLFMGNEAPEGHETYGIGGDLNSFQHLQYLKYNETSLTDAQYAAFDGSSVTEQEVETFAAAQERRNNLWEQHTASPRGKEQFVEVGDRNPIWHQDEQPVSQSVIPMSGTMEVMVVAPNPEMCLVVSAIQIWLLNFFVIFFEHNGIKDPTFSLGPMRPNEQLMPVLSTQVMERPITMQYTYEMESFATETVARDFIIEMEKVVLDKDGNEQSFD